MDLTQKLVNNDTLTVDEIFNAADALKALACRTIRNTLKEYASSGDVRIGQLYEIWYRGSYGSGPGNVRIYVDRDYDHVIATNDNDQLVNIEFLHLGRLEKILGALAHFAEAEEVEF